MLKPETAEKILSHIREEEIVKMACDVVNLPSPTGEELEMSKYMRAAMEDMGLEVSWQEVEPGRANVVGLWEGASAGKNLMFNGHMDTSNSGRETYLSGIGYKPHALIKHGMIYGLGIYNMKGALVCYLHAVKALQRAGMKPGGSIFVAAVVGEIEKTQWSDEFIGKEYRGYGVGTHYMVNHGIVPDMCILGEPTDMQVVLGHYGTIWVRLTTHGPYVHTAFTSGRERQNSIRRMQDVLSAVEEWIPSWEEKSSYQGKKGIANIGCIRGGYPWRASRAPERTDLCLDLRVPPTMQLQEARRSAKQLYLDLCRRFPDYGLEFEVYVSVPGAQIDKDHELVRTIEAHHQRIMGAPPKRNTVHWDSDASVMTRYGIETLNYGPSSGERDAEGEKVAIQTLVDITKIYALAAADICGAS